MAETDRDYFCTLASAQVSSGMARGGISVDAIQAYPLPPANNAPTTCAIAMRCEAGIAMSATVKPTPATVSNCTGCISLPVGSALCCRSQDGRGSLGDSGSGGSGGFPVFGGGSLPPGGRSSMRRSIDGSHHGGRIAHLTPAMLERSAARIDAILGGGAQRPASPVGYGAGTAPIHEALRIARERARPCV